MSLTPYHGESHKGENILDTTGNPPKMAQKIKWIHMVSRNIEKSKLLNFIQKPTC